MKIWKIEGLRSDDDSLFENTKKKDAMDNNSKYKHLTWDFLRHCARMTSTMEEMAEEIDRLQKALAERDETIQRLMADIVQKEGLLAQRDHSPAHVQVTNHFYEHVGNAVGTADTMTTTYDQRTEQCGQAHIPV